MANDLGYGQRLSEPEYQAAIVALYADGSHSSDRETAVRRKELDLAIDHRLGKDFPAARREALWKIQQKVEARRLRLAIHWMTRWFSQRRLETGANKLAGFLMHEYRKVLSAQEMKAFFGSFGPLDN